MGQVSRKARSLLVLKEEAVVTVRPKLLQRRKKNNKITTYEEMVE